MKWREPAIGEERTHRRFAWLPLTLNDHENVWLGFYWLTERYVLEPDLFGPIRVWRPIAASTEPLRANAVQPAPQAPDSRGQEDRE